ncbi:glycoside hydrolase family 3 protein [Hydnomerulius pinastri MD-312]|uniref:beta-glucosidase n=1 Tax=Hydnomerulius pinastri MD-312 TaxID=994086 RepID=A0A0C9WDY0_9AGAM|nr:glycoside hydrolase family 3 protein [Hydnomerulius pinastri MD-312]
MPPSDFKNADVDGIVEKLTTDEAILLTAGVGFWRTHEVPRLGIPAIKVRTDSETLLIRITDFKNADVDDIIEKLTTDEAILLTAGVGFWHTHEVPRLGIPAIKVCDGPNGIRGNHFFMSTPAKCLPSATALGATWDTELIEEVGLKLLAGEAKLRAAPVILAPTCNIQRNPLGGRAFESFSEDPLLSGMIAAAYVKGVQKGGIGSTIKHFVCNDKENDRMAYDSILSERALREIYLMPFMLAQKYAKPWAFMTAYNRVNGTHASENRHLLQDILRNEWKFDGLIMSDWFGVYSIDLSINAGLDLEMPGTNKWRMLDLMNRSITSRKLTVRTVKERARKVVELAKRVAQEAPEMAEAVKLASEADVVIAVVGLNADWETGGYDRKTLALPGRTDELITKVLAANPKTIVVTQSGSSITLPWADSVPAIVHSWYLGNSTGAAIADVLLGNKNPSGKLSLTFPKRLEDISGHGHFHSENGVGYKHFQHRGIAPQFAFGHGLSYTTFAYSDLQLSTPVVANGDFSLSATVTVTNTGKVAGSEVVQLYVSMPKTSDLTHPELMLRAFHKVKDLASGASQKVTITVDKYAVSYWEDRITRWVIEKGEYGVKVGSSSDSLPLSSTFVVSKGLEWNGL